MPAILSANVSGGVGSSSSSDELGVGAITAIVIVCIAISALAAVIIIGALLPSTSSRAPQGSFSSLALSNVVVGAQFKASHRF